MNLIQFDEVFSDDEVIIKNRSLSHLGIGDKAFKSFQRGKSNYCAEALGVGSSVSVICGAPTVAGFLGYGKTFLGLV